LDPTLPVRSIIGSLLYLSNATRPDITQSVNMVARYMSRPTQLLFNACKRILRYLKGTAHYAIKYSKTHYDAITDTKLDATTDTKLDAISDTSTYAKQDYGTDLIAWTDSDWAGDHISRRSTSGYLVQFAHGPLLWGSPVQQTISTSSTEAELVAAYTGIKKIMYARNILSELSYPLSPTVVFQDNRAAILIQKSLHSVKRVRHMEIKYFYSCQLIAQGKIKVLSTPTSEMVADIFTKALAFKKFKHFTSLFMTEM